jgi:hypothetical protein
VPSSAAAIARSRRARIRSIELRHLSRATRDRADRLIADAIALRGGSSQCWFVECTRPGVIEAIAPYTETEAVAISLCRAHAAMLQDEVIPLSSRRLPPA